MLLMQMPSDGSVSGRAGGPGAPHGCGGGLNAGAAGARRPPRPEHGVPGTEEAVEAGLGVLPLKPAGGSLGFSGPRFPHLQMKQHTWKHTPSCWTRGDGSHLLSICCVPALHGFIQAVDLVLPAPCGVSSLIPTL